MDLSGAARLRAVTHPLFAGEAAVGQPLALPGCAQLAADPRNTSAILYRADRTEAKRWAIAPATLDHELEPFGVRLLVTR